MAAGGTAWIGAWAGRTGFLVGVTAIGLLAAAVWRRPAVVALACMLAAGAVSGAASIAREEAVLAAGVPSAPVTIQAVVKTDPIPGRFGVEALIVPVGMFESERMVPWEGPPMVARFGAPTDLQAGQEVRLSGESGMGGRRWRGDPIAGALRVTDVELISAGGPLFSLANAMRRVVSRRLDDSDQSSALLAGFLIGDTSGLSDSSLGALRRSGLSHFVAVSGSNVALFLLGWWLLMGPLAWSPRRRAVLGLLGLVVFVVATRWEPSVVRAGVMAGLVLGGRLANVPLGAWGALGGAVTLVLTVSGELVGDVGFQLSVAATAGVLAASKVFSGRRPRWLFTALAATTGAQVAVAPLLIIHFGTLPLFSPIANVLAAPLVTVATAAAGIGVATGFGWVVAVGRLSADLVLGVAAATAGLPQLGPLGMSIAGGLLLAARSARLRPVATLMAALATLALVLPPPIAAPEAVFLDVGQGDATLLRSPDGTTVLFDGGPDPARLEDHLERLGVRHLDLLVVSHRHADHTAGLIGLARRLPVRAAWLPQQLGEGGTLDVLVDELSSFGVPIAHPQAGWSAWAGPFRLEVVGPLRRYASPNDGSIVVMVAAAGRSLLMAGDVETIAQRELGALPADVMKVPHQGAATSDEGWLTASAPGLAVISVGPNSFGHPSQEVIGLLDQSGAQVRRTDQEGSIVVRFDRLPSPP